ncbi:MAG: glutathione synthase [Gammaproteobacteria bacterium]|nr:glutathione synthase [Gammaproteobacteria bacterium]
MKTLALLMDPFEKLVIYRDSSLMIIEAALKRGLQVFVFESQDLMLEQGEASAHMTEVLSCDITQKPDWYQMGKKTKKNLSTVDAIVIRKDPPFDIDYVFLTYLLERAEKQGVKVANSPSAIRDCNEKLVIFNFPQCIVPTIVSCHRADLHAFWLEQGEIILKPLDGLGGRNIFYLKPGDTNFSVMVENLTQHGKRHIMAQRYLPEVREGDKRIILIDGEPAPLALARIPRNGESRGNLSSGGLFQAQDLTHQDRWICQQISPFLKEKGILFAGLDVIGDYMTEINLTSPGCLREISNACGQNLADLFLDRLIN